MTKSEAIEAMKSGAKLTHTYFTPKEWVTMKGNHTIITEEGYRMSNNEFWAYRTGESFENGWNIWYGGK